MARARSPERDKAFEIWKESGGKQKLKDIAAHLGVGETLVRKWKNQDKWDDKLKVTLPKTKGNVTKHKGNKKADKVIEIENPELTEKQRLFCLYYIKNFNATMAAIKAGYSKDTAHVQGPRLLGNVRVKEEIRHLKGKIQEEIFIDVMDVLNKYIKIAFSDITDFVEFGQKEVQVIGAFGPVYEDGGEEGEEKRPVTKIVNFVDFKPSREIDGTIITEVKQGKEGVSIKLADKMKALEKLELYFDLLPDKWKRQLEEEKLQLQKKKLDIDDKDKVMKVVIVDNIPEDDEDASG